MNEEKIDKEIKNCENKLKDLNQEISMLQEEINEMEVEHFLKYGPGKDYE